MKTKNSILGLCIFALSFIAVTSVYAQDCCDDITYCLSSSIPTPFLCNPPCVGANSCKWLHIENITCDEDAIDKVEVTITKDDGSSSYSICDPFTNWGDCDHPDFWNIVDENTNTVTPGNCYSWGMASSHTFTFTPPSSGYHVSEYKHFMTTICGAATISVRVHFYASGTGYWCSSTGSLSTSESCGTCDQQECDCQ